WLAYRVQISDAATATFCNTVRTPWAAIALNARTAYQMVLVQPPRLEEVNEILKDIEAASLRVGATMASVRGLFKEAADQPTNICVEDVARQVLRLLQQELQFKEISVVTELLAAPPSVSADPAQLQQVILNLIKNAIEAMNSVPVGDRRL